MPKKIIQILGHTLNNDEKLYYHVYGNWAARQARNNLITAPEYINEVWYAVCNLPEQKKIEKDKIIYRLFPARTLWTLLESYHGITWSEQLFAALKEEDDKSTIIHVQGERGRVLHKILSNHNNFKIIIQMHGYGQAEWLDWLENIWITPQERKNFRYVSHIFVPTRTRRDYLLNVLKMDPEVVSFQYTGVDFERFKPMDRITARKKLNLPDNAFIMIYVGAMVKTKGVDKIIAAYQNLRQKYPNLYLVLIGANESDVLYQKAKKTADRLIGVVDNSEVPLYYNAADVYCFYGTPKTRRYAGLGVAPSEALACNLNVVSTNLIHFPPELVDKIGYVPKSYEDFVNKIDWLINHPNFRYNARDIVEPLTSSAYTTRNMVNVYKALFNQL